jgi:hypothetical protein
MFENCYISSYWNCISYKKADFSFQFLHRGQKRLWFFCLLILLSKLLSATQHSAKTKFIPRSRAAAQNLAPLPFLCFQSLSSKYDCPADVVLRRTSRTYRLFKVQKIHVSCHESLPFLNVVLIFAIGCRRNKLVSPA